MTTSDPVKFKTILTAEYQGKTVAFFEVLSSEKSQGLKMCSDVIDAFSYSDINIDKITIGTD